MIEDPFVAMMAALTRLMTEHADLYIPEARAAFAAIATLLTVWFGLSMSGRYVDWDGARRLGLSILFGSLFLSYYPTVVEMFIIGMQYLANLPHVRMMNDIQINVNNLWLRMEKPSVWAPADWLAWVLVFGSLVVLKTVIFVYMSYGYFALAILLIAGPVFWVMSFFPGMSGARRSWFRASLQYAFYPMFANLSLLVLGSLLMGFLNQIVPNVDASTLLGYSLTLAPTLLGAAFLMTKIPHVVNEAFSGAVGGSNFRVAFWR